MENEPFSAQSDDSRMSKKSRFMGKLFGSKESKETRTEAANVEAFLHSSADNLNVTHPPPPPPPSSAPRLAKLDTSITRYPQALAVNQSAQLNRPVAPGRPESKSPQRSPQPNRKGYRVRFTDSYPDVIGEGGDESEVPVIEISRNKVAQPPQPPVHRQQAPPAGRPLPGAPPGAGTGPTAEDDFQPKLLRRTQTGYSSIYEPDGPDAQDNFQPQPPRRTQTGYSSIYEPGGADAEDSFQPKPIRRTQTGYSSIYEPENELQPPLPAAKPFSRSPNRSPQPPPNTVSPGHGAPPTYLESSSRRDENRRSFIETQQAQMSLAEGKAFVQAARTYSTASDHRWEDGEPPSENTNDSTESLRRQQSASPEAQRKTTSADYSPTHSMVSSNSSLQPPTIPPSGISQTSILPRVEIPNQRNGHTPDPTQGISTKFNEMAVSPEDDTLQTFISRTKHLFELFRLHAESVQPLSSCSLQACARGGLWWFLKGRMGLEAAIRERPGSPRSQMQNEMDRQQAYSNLAKGYWLCEEIIPELCQSMGYVSDAEIATASQNLVSALRKLSSSMERNGFLPPEEAFLPQSIDKSIWLEYPPLSQDMLALLSGNRGSGMTAMQQPISTLSLLDALPVGDTAETFNYGRVPADVYLMEQGRENQRFYLPCMLSTSRPQHQTGLIFMLGSQDGSVQLAMSDNKKSGVVWEDVRWNNDTCTLDVRLPRGFMLTVQLAQTDYRMLWSMFDFGAKVRASLAPRTDEVFVFRNTLRAFQYLDSDPQSRAFPKEPVPHCEAALFERIYKENGPSGQRTWHTGFRIAVVSGPRTRTLSGVHHSFSPSVPIQFGFFRADGDGPALSVKFDNGRQRGRMVLIFSDERERIRFNSLMTGTSIDHNETIFADVPIKNYMISQSIREPTGMAPFSRMPWKAVRVVNDECGPGEEGPSTVLADRLKLVLEYQDGTITDRMNVAPGELRVRLEVSNAKLLRFIRQPQRDITMAVSESQVPKELPKALYDALQLIKSNQTIRTLEFNSLKDLHDFQAAATGFEVVFDSLAVTFAIARRRMVVPIHKKWEAGFTRIQVIRNEDKQLQLLAFFEDFSHGHCMNFLLKGTDVYESFHRGGKFGVKFVDAKFPLPGLPTDKDGDFDEMAFVCLDLPDLPGEHDDISILFETEADRDRLCQCLPASVKGSSVRLSSRLK